MKRYTRFLKYPELKLQNIFTMNGGLMSPSEYSDRETNPPMSERIYSNQGNLPLINMHSEGCGRVLDVGCGAGRNKND